MKSSIALFCSVVAAAGCASSGGKYIDPRSDLERKIYYLEKDRDNVAHPISSTVYDKDQKRVERVPMPAVVDVNSAIQILVAKQELVAGATSGPVSKELEPLLKRKDAALQVLRTLKELAEARQRTIASYEKKDKKEFFSARAVSDKLEKTLIAQLRTLWPPGHEVFPRLQSGEAYDRPRFERLQELLAAEVASIEAASRKLESELRTRGRTLSLEAFLLSPGKEPVAIHMDGYDAIKQQELRRHDQFGLDLSPSEREKLNAHIAANQSVAATLEQLRTGEIALNEAVRRMAAEMSPEIAALAAQAERLAAELDPAELAARKKETDALVDAALDAVKRRNATFTDAARKSLQGERDKLVNDLPREARDLVGALEAWLKEAKTLREQWAKASPTSTALARLITDTVAVGRKFEGASAKLPDIASALRERVDVFVRSLTSEAAAAERDFLKSPEVAALRENLETYVRDLEQGAKLITEVVLLLGRTQARELAEMPSTPPLAFSVPVGELKDTFIELEATPRLIGDSVVVKATLRDGTKTPETSEARFLVGRYGHYAELSPAVILVKPEQLAGGDDGFRFAPSLSWMHHWAPRPEERGATASFFRAMDPAIGIHSAFTNFNSPTSDNSIQIGLGATLAFWRNRMQFGLGYNLMAKSKEEGRYYYFVGSDLIGMLQAVGLAK